MGKSYDELKIIFNGDFPYFYSPEREYRFKHLGYYKGRRCGVLFTFDDKKRVVVVDAVGPGCYDNWKGRSETELKTIPVDSILSKLSYRNVADVVRLFGMYVLSLGSCAGETMGYTLDRKFTLYSGAYEMLKEFRLSKCGFTVRYNKGIINDVQLTRNNACVYEYYPNELLNGIIHGKY